MKFNTTTLQDVYLIDLDPKIDSRGSFTRIFCKNELGEIGFKKQIVQINHSVTNKKGTLRGMHFQSRPAAETKIIRLVSGEIYDVIIDLRQDSPTYMKWEYNVLSREKSQILFIPEGFAHGFQALTDNVGMIYQHSEFYNPEYERGLPYDDPKLRISWPLPITEMSERDQNHPYIKNKIFI